MKDWLDRRGISGKDLFYMLAGVIPLTIFVGLGLYGLIGSLIQ